MPETVSCCAYHTARGHYQIFAMQLTTWFLCVMEYGLNGPLGANSRARCLIDCSHAWVMGLLSLLLWSDQHGLCAQVRSVLITQANVFLMCHI